MERERIMRAARENHTNKTEQMLDADNVVLSTADSDTGRTTSITNFRQRFLSRGLTSSREWSKYKSQTSIKCVRSSLSICFFFAFSFCLFVWDKLITPNENVSKPRIILRDIS